MNDYTNYSTKLDLNVKDMLEALRQKNLERALVEGCTAMHNLYMILDWIHDHEDES